MVRGSQQVSEFQSLDDLNIAGLSSVIAELAAWKQGDIICAEGGTAAQLPLSWLRPPVDRAIASTPTTSQTCKPHYNSAHLARFVVASQTCDLLGEGTGARHPFALAAPLFSSASISRSDWKLAEQLRVPYRIPSTYRPPDGSRTPWFVDLRVLLPISKGVLLAHQSGGPAFDAYGLMRFSAGLAHKFSRAAVDNDLIDILPRALDAHVMSKGPTDEVFVNTEEVRLLVDRGSWVTPGSRARVLILVKKSVLKSARETWTGWEETARKDLKKHNINLGPTTVTTARRLKSHTYRQTSALRVSALGTLVWP